MNTITETQANDIWDILVNICGAHKGYRHRENFVVKQISEDPPVEYRFCGNLGFGGKLWRNNDRIYVSCYREDETPEILQIIEEANEALSKIG